MRKVELSGLTGIRFYAALPVYLAHVTVIPGMEALSGGSVFFNLGVGSVSLFFVLSGFILTYNYADVFRDGVSAAGYKRFVWDRLTKISRSLLDAAAGAAHRDLQPAPAPRLARGALPSVIAAVLLAVRVTGVLEVFERPV